MDDIIITIENYKGQIITFTMPQDAEVNVFEELNGFDQFTNYIDRISIDASYPGIEKFIEYTNEE